MIAGVHEYGKRVTDAESGLEVFDAPTSHALIQAGGLAAADVVDTGHGGSPGPHE